MGADWGFFDMDPPGVDVMLTPLAQQYNNEGLVWASNLPTLFETLMQNITLSLAAVSYNQTSITTCQYTELVSVFVYHRSALWIAYGAALGVTIVSVLLGTIAMRANSFGGTVGFSAFLQATMNSSLRAGSVGNRTMLRYGLMNDGGDERKGKRVFGREAEFHSSEKDSERGPEHLPFLG